MFIQNTETYRDYVGGDIEMETQVMEKKKIQKKKMNFFLKN